jgi:hypothetical protein
MSFWIDKLAELSNAPTVKTNSANFPSQLAAAPWWASQSHPQIPLKAPETALPSQPTSTATVGEALAMVVDPRLTKAQSVKNINTCPECSSGNFRGGMGSNEMSHCFDCGYNPRFIQQAAGIPSDRSGSATPARQIQTGGYNPQTIIGRIG